MADLFRSYKSKDRARVKPLVEAMQADGLSVWWDAHIEGGAGWRQAIQTELALAQLDRAVKNRDPGLIQLRVDPALDRLRQDPRFAAMERRVGFPPI